MYSHPLAGGITSQLLLPLSHRLFRLAASLLQPCIFKKRNAYQKFPCAMPKFTALYPEMFAKVTPTAMSLKTQLRSGL